MKQANDHKTVDLFPGSRGRGRPPSSDTKTAAQRQAERRQRLREEGLVPLTVHIPAELHAKLTKFLQHKDTTKDVVLERFLSNALRKR